MILYSLIYVTIMSASKSTLALGYYQAKLNSNLHEFLLKIHANIIYSLSKCRYLITYKLLNRGCRGGRVRKRRGETPRVGKEKHDLIGRAFPMRV